MIAPDIVTIENLRSGRLKQDLPEFYELDNSVENGGWHSKDPVSNHTLSVLQKLEPLLEASDLQPYLDEIIDKTRKKVLLFLAALFHDIGKKEAMKEQNGITTCTDHENIGEQKAAKILERFDLSSPEKQRILSIVKNHSGIHFILDPGNPARDEQLEKMKQEYPEIFLDLILLGYADTMGSQLATLNPDEYKYRMDQYKKIIDSVHE